MTKKNTSSKSKKENNSSHTKELDHIIVLGAKEHNLKNIDVEIP